MQEERNARDCRETTGTETLFCEIAQLVQQYGPEFAALHQEEMRIIWRKFGFMSEIELEQIPIRLRAIGQRMEEMNGTLLGVVHRLMLKLYSGEQEVQDEAFRQNHYYTFGTDKGYPFCGGYIIIQAADIQKAHAIFRRHFPDRIPGCLNCADYYTQEAFAKTGMLEDNLGAVCHAVFTT